MSDSVYKVVTLIGTSAESWEKAAKAAVEAASHSLRNGSCQAGHGGQRWQGGSLPDQSQAVVQI